MFLPHVSFRLGFGHTLLLPAKNYISKYQFVLRFPLGQSMCTQPIFFTKVTVSNIAPKIPKITLGGRMKACTIIGCRSEYFWRYSLSKFLFYMSFLHFLFLLFLIFSHFYVGSMCLMRRLHLVLSCVSSLDNSFSDKSFPMVSSHLRFGLPLLLFPGTSIPITHSHLKHTYRGLKLAILTN